MIIVKAYVLCGEKWKIDGCGGLNLCDKKGEIYLGENGENIK